MSLSGTKLQVTQIKSAIGRRPLCRRVLLGLGLGRPGRTRILEDTPAVRGMIARVAHLVTVDEAQERQS